MKPEFSVIENDHINIVNNVNEVSKSFDWNISLVRLDVGLAPSFFHFGADVSLSDTPIYALCVWSNTYTDMKKVFIKINNIDDFRNRELFLSGDPFDSVCSLCGAEISQAEYTQEGCMHKFHRSCYEEFCECLNSFVDKYSAEIVSISV